MFNLPHTHFSMAIPKLITCISGFRFEVQFQRKNLKFRKFVHSSFKSPDTCWCRNVNPIFFPEFLNRFYYYFKNTLLQHYSIQQLTNRSCFFSKKGVLIASWSTAMLSVGKLPTSLIQLRKQMNIIHIVVDYIQKQGQ